MDNKYSFSNLQKLVFQQGSIFILLIGLFFRMMHFIESRSFWLDEAYVALEISQISLKDIFLFKSFSTHLQAPPPMLFLFIEKVMINLFGNCEDTLRFFPFLSAIFSLYLFYIFTKKFLNKKSGLFALAIFALSDPLIYYAAELKPYASDLFVALIIYLFYSRQRKQMLSFPSFLLWGMLGTLSIFLSYPSIYVLAGIGCVWAHTLFFKKDKRWIFQKILVLGWWALSFLCLYYLSIQRMLSTRPLMDVMHQFPLFPPFPFSSFEMMKEFFVFMQKNLVSPLGLSFSLIWIGIILIGMGVSFKRRKEDFIIFFMPIFFCLCAAWLHKYPFVSRFLFFLIPSLFFFLVQGIDFILERMSRGKEGLVVLLLFLMFVLPLKNLYGTLLSGRERQDIRGIMQILKNEYQPQDAIVFNRHSIFGFGYYHGILGMKTCRKPIVKMFFKENSPESKPQTYLAIYFFNRDGFLKGFVEAKDLLSEEQEERALKNARTWVVLSHLKPYQHQHILKLLTSQGKIVKVFPKKDAYLYLVDFSVFPSNTENN